MKANAFHSLVLKALFITGFGLLLAPIGPSQSASKNKKPERMIHGQRLAYHVAKVALANYGNLTHQEEKIKFGQMLGTLYLGSDFTPYSNLNRWLLEQWMLQRPDQSITPLQLMTHSLHLTGGNTQDALILCWDVLREDWKNTEYRNLLPRSLKLADITGELEDFDGNDHLRAGRPIKTIRGDNFSAWYHFFGTAINAYVASKSMTALPAGIYSWLMVYLEENWFHDEFIDSRKRIAIDNAGSAFGLHLNRILKTYKTYDQFEPTWRIEAAKGSYITSDPELFDKNWSLKENQHPRDFGTNQMSKTAPSMMAKATAMLNEAKAQNTASATILQNRIHQNHQQLAAFAATLLATYPDTKSPQQSYEILNDKINYGNNQLVIGSIIEHILLSQHFTEQQKIDAVQRARTFFRGRFDVEKGILKGMAANLVQNVSLVEKNLLDALSNQSIGNELQRIAAQVVFKRKAMGLPVSATLLNSAQKVAHELHLDNQNLAGETFRMKAFKNVCRVTLLHLSGLH